MTDTVTRKTDQATLPHNWETVRLDDIAEITLGQSPPSTSYNDAAHGLPFFQGKAEFGSLYPTVAKWCSEPKKIAEGGDVLISVRAPVGPTNICPETACIGRGLAAIRGLGGIETKFVLYSLRASQNELASKATGTTFPAITGNTLKAFTMPLPPLNEQRRIVQKIEELFTKLDAGVRSLKQAREQLKSYRRSVLKAAVEGELSREWREAHWDELESASELLARIRDEQLKWIESEDKRGDTEARRLGTKLKKHAFQPPDDIQLPATWSWTSLLEACWRVVDCHNKTAPYEASGVPLVRTSNIRKGRLMLDSVKHVSEDTYRFWSRRCPPEPRDILFTREAPMGEVAIIPANTRVCMGQRMMLLRVFEDLLNVRYLAYAMQEPHFQSRLIAKQVGSGVQHLRVGDVESLAIALPPLKEQHFIVEEVERRLSVVDKLEATVQENLKQAAGLRQSILKQAFSGELVPQDPDDEPASVLLECIQKEREERKASKKKQSRKPRPAADVREPSLFSQAGE